MMTNNRLKTVIIDDEQRAIEKLADDLKLYGSFDVAGYATDPLKGAEIIMNTKPDVIFMDIEMPGMTGLELIEKIRPMLSPYVFVVFYSAFDKYMLDALRASAFDYLLKPYKKEELDEIVIRLRNSVSENKGNIEQSLRALMNIEKKFAIQTVTGLLFVKEKDLLFFEYLPCRCCQVKTAGCTLHRLKVNTKAEDILAISSSMIQIRKDMIINSDYLASIDSVTLRCHFYPPFSDLDIQASRRYFQKVRDMMDII